MKPHAPRLENLQAIIEARFDGKAGRLADFLGKPRPTIYRLFSTKKTGRKLGEGQAREFEEKLGLAPFALDAELGKAGEVTQIRSVEKIEVVMPSISLAYVTPEETEVLTRMREATEIGRNAIIAAARNAPRDQKKLRKITKPAA